MDIEKTVKNLELRGFSVRRFATGAEAAAYLASALKGSSVGIGGSKTIDQLGLYDMLEPGSAYWHWRTPGEDTYAKAAVADAYLTGANAISESGEIFNIDGRGNRLAGQLFGHKKVYIVSSVKKICPDFDSALYRARNTAAIENGKRFNNSTPCKIDGKCHDCRSKERICNALVVLWGPMMGMSEEIILINEELGM